MDEKTDYGYRLGLQDGRISPQWEDMSNMADYGYRLGLQDGRTAAQWVVMGRPVHHGDLLSATDDYARGYRDGLQEVTG